MTHEFNRPLWWWTLLLATYVVLLVLGATQVRPVSRCAVTEKQPRGCAVRLGPAAR